MLLYLRAEIRLEVKYQVLLTRAIAQESSIKDDPSDQLEDMSSLLIAKNLPSGALKLKLMMFGNRRERKLMDVKKSSSITTGRFLLTL